MVCRQVGDDHPQRPRHRQRARSVRLQVCSDLLVKGARQRCSLVTEVAIAIEHGACHVMQGGKDETWTLM